jgi:hypothetical protein
VLVMRWQLIVLALTALTLAACGGADQEEDDAVPPPAGDGLLLWQEASYAVSDRLPPDALDAGGLQALGEARADSDTTTVFRWQAGARDWEIITQEGDRWLVWEPRAVGQARRDLAERLGVIEADIEVRQVERVRWPDACLGAPQPNEVCAQVITDGFQVELAAGAKTYSYHTDLGVAVRLAP